MTVDLRVEDGGDFLAAARRLKSEGHAELRKELLKAIAAATKAPKAQARMHAAQILPHRGGLAQLISTAALSTSTTNRGVKVRARRAKSGGQIALSSIDRGVLKHPVFGHMDRWVTQAVPPGWFSKPMEAAAPQIRQSLVHAMDDIARKIEGHHL